MVDPSRFALVAPLVPLRGFRRALAVDRERERAVVVATAPAELGGVPGAVDALRARAGAASALRHPGLAAILGAAAQGDPAIVEEYRPGVSLRELLDAAGRLPAEVAARAVLDAAEGLARAHVLDAGAGARLAHGAVDPSTVLIAEEGPAFVSGLGVVGGAAPEGDVRALGAVLYECLSGEPPGAPPVRLALPGVPSALAAVVDRAIGADGAPFASIAALAEAVASAVAPASHAAVAAYADAVVPPDAGTRAELRRALSAALGEEEVSAELVVDADPVPAAPRPELRAAAADAVRTFAAPAPPPASARLPVAIGAIALAIGFAIGLLAERLLR